MGYRPTWAVASPGMGQSSDNSPHLMAWAFQDGSAGLFGCLGGAFRSNTPLGTAIRKSPLRKKRRPESAPAGSAKRTGRSNVRSMRVVWGCQQSGASELRSTRTQEQRSRRE